MFNNNSKIQISIFLFISLMSLSLVNKTGYPVPISYFYWGVKYNSRLLFDSNNDREKQWTWSINKRFIHERDSIELFLQADYSFDFHPMIIIKDSASKNMIRRFPGTDKIALKDVLKYATTERNRFWLLYTEQDPEKDGTVLWDIEKTYPKKRGYPRLYITIIIN